MRAKILYYLILVIVILTLTSCMDNLEYTPRAAVFSDFYPLDGTSGIEPFISLYWSCEFASYYQLYFGTNSDSLDMIEDNLIVSEQIIDELALGTTYYWQVVAYNGGDTPEYGPVLSFSTRDGEWGEFYPVNEADSLSLSVVFTWGMSRTDKNNFNNNDVIKPGNDHREDPALIYYDLYLGESADSLMMIIDDTTYQFGSVSNLYYNIDYYWQVKARNYVSELASSPIMTFRTRPPVWEAVAPVNEAVDQEVNTQLIWSIDGNNRENNVKGKSNIPQEKRSGDFVYDLFGGEDPEELELIAEGLEDSNYNLENLNYRDEYFWQVKGIYKSTQELMSPVFQFETKDRFSEIFPEDYETYVEINPELSWSCVGAESYDLYLGSDETGMYQVADDIRDTTYTVHDLAYETIYHWQVRALLTDSSFWNSPVMNFITISDPIPPGYKLHEHLIRAEMPCNIDVVYRVTDRADNVITDLVESDFRFLEDGEEIDAVESALHIYTGTEINTTNRTVLMIDNSTSMDSLLDAIKLAAFEFVENLESNQEMCVYSFSEQTELIEDFTSNQADLVSAINSIHTGYSSTNLYGAVITGVARWEDDFVPENIIKGNMIMITDGSDTQGSSSLEEALEARGDKQIFTLGIGNDIDAAALNALGNGGFYALPTAGEAMETFMEIQDNIRDYLLSFYWLNYITPKRGNIDHTIEISVIDNPNTGNSGMISGTFNSNGFYGTVPGVYVNIDPENGLPYGIEEYTISDSTDHILEAVTYNATSEPEYQWEVENPSILQLVLTNANAHKLIIHRGDQTGTTELTVRDIINGHQRVIDIRVE